MVATDGNLVRRPEVRVPELCWGDRIDGRIHARMISKDSPLWCRSCVFAQDLVKIFRCAPQITPLRLLQAGNQKTAISLFQLEAFGEALLDFSQASDLEERLNAHSE
jgi:hypothetical protein